MELFSHDNAAYDKYVAWCDRLGMPASVFDLWEKTTRGVSDGWGTVRKEQMKPSPRRNIQEGPATQ